MVNDPAVKQVVVEQTKQWSEMMERHRKENWELMRDHLKAQEDVLRELMKAQQKMQIKELENFFEKYVIFFKGKKKSGCNFLHWENALFFLNLNEICSIFPGKTKT